MTQVGKKPTEPKPTGTDWARVAQWDGSGWKVVSDWYQADKSMVEPLVKEYGEKYAKEKNVKMRTCN